MIIDYTLPWSVDSSSISTSRSTNSACAGLSLTPRSRGREPFAAVHLGKCLRPARTRRPLHRERVGADRRRVEIALERPARSPACLTSAGPRRAPAARRPARASRSPRRTRGAPPPADPPPGRTPPSGSTRRRRRAGPRADRPGARSAPRPPSPPGGTAGSRRCERGSPDSLWTHLGGRFQKTVRTALFNHGRGHVDCDKSHGGFWPDGTVAEAGDVLVSLTGPTVGPGNRSGGS